MTCEMRGVVWDEFCELCETIWVKLREKEATQEEKEEKARNTNLKTKAPHRDVRKKHNLMSCVMMFKKARRRLMLQRYNDKNTQQKRAQTTNRLTCTNDPLLTCTDEPRTAFVLIEPLHDGIILAFFRLLAVPPCIGKISSSPLSVSNCFPFNFWKAFQWPLAISISKSMVFHPCGANVQSRVPGVNL